MEKSYDLHNLIITAQTVGSSVVNMCLVGTEEVA